MVTIDPTPSIEPPPRALDSTPRAILRAVLIVLSVVLALWIVYLLRQPLSWLVIALFLAVAMSGPVNRLNRFMRRGFAIAVAYLGLLLIPVLLGAILVPSIVRAANGLAEDVPGYVEDLQKTVNDNKRLRELDEDYQITQKLEEEARKLPGKLGGAAEVLADLGSGLVSTIFAGVTIFILSIFMVSSGRSWAERFIEMQPIGRQERLRRAFQDSANAVGAYVAGMLAQATIAGLSTYVVLRILGVPFAGALAVVVFFFDLIPLVGATIAAILVGLVTLFNDFPVDTIIWAVWAIVYQQVENTVIQPRIQARAVNVQPFIVLVAVLFGSTLFGIAGALMAIPAAASLQIGIREYAAYRKEVRVAVATGQEPPPPPAANAPAEAPT